MESEGENCYIPSGDSCFLESNNFIFKKDLTKEYFELIQSYKRRTDVMTGYKITKCLSVLNQTLEYTMLKAKK